VFRRSVAVPIILALALAGCPRHAPKPRPSGSGNPSAVPGGTLRVAVRALETLDPARAVTPGSLKAIAQIFAPLTRIDPASGEVVPGVARWETKDLKKWTFRLTRSVYSDGKVVTADDYKFAFDRIARRDVASDLAFQLDQVAGFADERLLGKANALSGVVALRANVLVFNLVRPFAEFPYKLAHPALAPLQRAKYARSAAGLSSAPIGNGPFRVQQGPPSGTVVLARNDGYAGPSPYLDAIEFKVVPDLADAASAYRDGNIDVTDVPSTFIDSAGNRSSEGESPLWATLSFGPNLKDAKYANVNVRRALSLAVDRESIARTVYGGTKDPATGIVPKGVRGYVANACAMCVHDIARARSFLQRARLPRQLALTIDHLPDRSSRAVAAAVKANLESIGVRVTLRAHDKDAYFALLKSGRNYDFAQLGWLADVPTPDGFLAGQLRSHSLDNQTNFTDHDFDHLVDAARAQPDEAKRLGLYRRAEQRALTLMPLVPIVFFRNHTAIAARVHDLHLDGAGVFDGARVWVTS
jgi:peptide/nickel transport system substrate-binding protein/oligopeptide transport system substrate-binding protein